MKKALMYASVASMIEQFNMNNIKLLQELGYKVDVACNFEFGSSMTKEKINKLKSTLKDMNVNYFNIPISRKITDIKKLKQAYTITLKLMNKESYDLIHCHSPIGGMICRLANRNSNNFKHCKMIYTAHGFHFFKGNNPIKNLIFRNIEKLGAKYTDILITINENDYQAANQFNLKRNGYVFKIPGVGINYKKFDEISSIPDIRSSLGIKENDFVILSVGELNRNKNHQVIIRSLAELHNANIHYIICGQGAEKNNLSRLIGKLNLDKNVHLLGYQNNIEEYCAIADIFAFPSLREGLGLAAIEAMAAGLPIITSNRGGISEYSKNGITGFSCNPSDIKAFSSAIDLLYNDEGFRKSIGLNNKHVAMNYDIAVVQSKMRDIYNFTSNEIS